MKIVTIIIAIIKRITWWNMLYPHIINSTLFHLWHKLNAIIASSLYSDPSKDMTVIGVTGTDGKTTTVNLIHHVLTELGHKTVVIGTTWVKIGTQVYPNTTKMSSPNPYVLNKILAEARDAGCTYAVIETTSHGLHQHRFHGIKYTTWVLTNITAEHLDYHKTIDDYAATKKILFSTIASQQVASKIGIFNKDDEYGRKWSSEIVFDKVFDYAIAMNATFKWENIVEYMNRTDFDCRYLGKTYPVSIQLVGKFNVYNTLACICCCSGLWFDIVDIIATLGSFAPVTGRQHIFEHDERTYIIDFAHTPNALEQMLWFIRRVNPSKRMITIFGAPWLRDKFKRPQMGYIVEQLSDVVILTEDDSLNEPTAWIIADVAKWITKQEWNNYYIIPERDMAIRFAYHYSQPWDIIVMAGKGHEQMLYTNFGKRKFNEYEYLMSVINDTYEEYYKDKPLEQNH